MGEMLVAPLCRCVWRGVPCEAPATQEDGLCDWCGPRRSEQIGRSPYAVVAADGKVMLGGGSATPYNHQAGRSGIPADARPSACWMEPAPTVDTAEAHVPPRRFSEPAPTEGGESE